MANISGKGDSGQRGIFGVWRFDAALGLLCVRKTKAASKRHTPERLRAKPKPARYRLNHAGVQIGLAA